MPLNDFKPTYRPVKSEDGRELGTVRGLSLDDIRVVCQGNLHNADKLADAVTRLGAGAMPTSPGGVIQSALSDEAVQGFLLQIIQDVPGLAVEIVARGGDVAEEDMGGLRQMSFGAQILILEAILECTFEEVGGVKKFWGVLARIVTRLVPPEATQAETPGS